MKIVKLQLIFLQTSVTTSTTMPIITYPLNKTWGEKSHQFLDYFRKWFKVTQYLYVIISDLTTILRNILAHLHISYHNQAKNIHLLCSISSLCKTLSILPHCPLSQASVLLQMLNVLLEEHPPLRLLFCCPTII